MSRKNKSREDVKVFADQVILQMITYSRVTRPEFMVKVTGAGKKEKCYITNPYFSLPKRYAYLS